MSDDVTIQTTAPAPTAPMPASLQPPAPAQASPANAATDKAIEAVVSGASPEATQKLFDRAAIEHRRANPDDGVPKGENDWRDGSLSPMPPAPSIAKTEVDAAIEKMQNKSPEHAALAAEWSGNGNSFAEELAYAKAAFQVEAATNPKLIEAVRASGAGDDPSILKFLARQGRLAAGLLNDRPPSSSRNNEPMPINRTTPAGPAGDHRGSEETRSELARLMREAPPGSARYKEPAIQNRIQMLHQMLAGSGNIIGRGDRRV